MQELVGQHDNRPNGPREQHRLRQPLLREPQARAGPLPVGRRPPDRRAVDEGRRQAARRGRLPRRVQELDPEYGGGRRAHRIERRDPKELQGGELMRVFDHAPLLCYCVVFVWFI